VRDWERRYRYRPLLLETFVQLDHHTGTSYRAANWIHVGTTDGYSLYSAKEAEVAKKAIFLCPLHPNFRERLKSPRTRGRYRPPDVWDFVMILAARAGRLRSVQSSLRVREDGENQTLRALSRQFVLIPSEPPRTR
jgi:hypothetical protein